MGLVPQRYDSGKQVSVRAGGVVSEGGRGGQ